MDKLAFQNKHLFRFGAPVIPKNIPAIPILAPVIPKNAPAIPFNSQRRLVIHSVSEICPCHSHYCPCHSVL